MQPAATGADEPMQAADYPALFAAADSAAARAQRAATDVLRAEYLLLVLASVLALVPSRLSAAGCAAAFLALLCLAAARAVLNPDTAWYRSRALAESVKTVAWRYMMRAPPFDGDAQAAGGALAGCLESILRSNPEHGLRAEDPGAPGTPRMQAVRGAPLEDRQRFYRSARLTDQRRWYRLRAEQTRGGFRRWVSLLMLVYASAALWAVTGAAFPSASGMPLAPLVVAAASIAGWMQARKFSELAAAYALTAGEIELLERRIAEPATDAGLGAFVNEAELAFSREHTQLSARRRDRP